MNETTNPNMPLEDPSIIKRIEKSARLHIKTNNEVAFALYITGNFGRIFSKIEEGDGENVSLPGKQIFETPRYEYEWRRYAYKILELPEDFIFSGAYGVDYKINEALTIHYHPNEKYIIPSGGDFDLFSASGDLINHFRSCSMQKFPVLDLIGIVYNNQPLEIDFLAFQMTNSKEKFEQSKLISKLYRLAKEFEKNNTPHFEGNNKISKEIAKSGKFNTTIIQYLDGNLKYDQSEFDKFCLKAWNPLPKVEYNFEL